MLDGKLLRESESFKWLLRVHACAALHIINPKREWRYLTTLIFYDRRGCVSANFDTKTARAMRLLLRIQRLIWTACAFVTRALVCECACVCVYIGVQNDNVVGHYTHIHITRPSIEQKIVVVPLSFSA